jgi:hypothetical protein
MTKNIFATLCGLLMFVMANQSYAQGVGFGVKGGLNLATLSGDVAAGTSKDNFTGYHFGVYGYYKFNPILGLQAEINYSQAGSKSSASGGGITAITTSTYNYMQVPLLLRVQAGAADFKFWGNAGPYAGFFLSGTSTAEATGFGKVTEDLKSGEDVASFDWGVMAGAGAGYKVGPGYITLDARYALGLAKVPGSNAGTLNPEDVKNRGFMVSLGYLFEF